MSTVAKFGPKQPLRVAFCLAICRPGQGESLELRWGGGVGGWAQSDWAPTRDNHLFAPNALRVSRPPGT
jgi:hypothetical protein